MAKKHKYPVVKDIGLKVHKQDLYEISWEYFDTLWKFMVRSKSEENISKGCLTYYKDFWLGEIAEPVGVGDTIVDVGAHSGFFSVPMSSHCNVIAFEPSPANYEMLNRNAMLNATQFQKYPWAVWNIDGTTTLNLGVQGTTGHSVSNKKRGGVSVDVTCVSLATVVKEHKPTILKLDCEGAEWGILSNPEDLQGIRMLIAELHKVKPELVDQLCNVLDVSGMQYTIKHNSWFSKLTAWRK